MRTIVCNEPRSFQMIETDEPIMKQGEAIVRIHTIGICGTDLHAYQGNQPYFTYPRVLGHELSGIIEEIDEETSRSNDLKKGDLVTIIPYMECGTCIACRSGKTNCCTQLQVLGVHADGGMREKIAVPADHLLKANGIAPEHAAVIEPLCIGAHAVRRAKLEAGETVLVIGVGPIGLGVMTFAKQQGARVIAMDINEERLAFASSWTQADETVQALDEPLRKLAELTDGDLPTAVFDATGNVRSMSQSFEYVAHGGRLIYVGLVKNEISFSDPDFHKKELTLMGSRNATREDFAFVMESMRSGKLNMDRYITHHCDFDRMIDEFDSWLLPESKVIKAVVQV